MATSRRVIDVTEVCVAWRADRQARGSGGARGSHPAAPWNRMDLWVEKIDSYRKQTDGGDKSIMILRKLNLG